MIEVRHLVLIDAVAEVGTLKKASEKLFLSQSALSHQLKELESRLGTPVFYRVNNQLLFTPAGRELLDASRDILMRLRQTKQSIQELNQDSLRKYTHGYSREESVRLNDQASSIAEILHWDSDWPTGSLILEAMRSRGSDQRDRGEKSRVCLRLSRFISIFVGGSKSDGGRT